SEISLPSQRISELLVNFSENQKNLFYKEWLTKNKEPDYLALDITSISSYSKLIDDVEWGYNRDHEKLPQINLCQLMSETLRLPIYQVEYCGSLKDVSTLEATIEKLRATVNVDQLTLVMDKGFYKQSNVSYLLGDESHKALPFLI